MVRLWGLAALGLLWATCYVGLVRQAWAHPFHITTAEMQFNSRTGRFEVALKLPIADLLQAVGQSQLYAESQTVSGLAGVAEVLAKDVDLKVDQRLERKAEAYLAKRFMLTTHSVSNDLANKTNLLEATAPSVAVQSTLHWVGLELERTTAWLYFELTPPTGPQKLFLVNKVLFDLNKGQSNTVVFLSDAGRVSLKTDEVQPERELPPSVLAVGRP